MMGASVPRDTEPATSETELALIIFQDIFNFFYTFHAH